MKSFLTYAAVLCGLALLCSPSARAERGLETEHERSIPERSAPERNTSDPDHGQFKSDRSAPASAPEVDPSMAIGGLALLAGSLTVLRSRRRSS